MKHHSWNATLPVVWATFAVSVWLVDGAWAQRTLPRGPEARAGSRLALRTDRRPDEAWSQRRPQGGSLSTDHPTQLEQASYDVVEADSAAPRPPVLRWRTVDRGPQQQIARRAAPSHQALARLEQPDGLAADEPAPFSPPENVSALSAATIPQEPPVNAPSNADQDDPPSPAAGRYAQSPSGSTASRSRTARRESEPVRDGHVVFEFEQLGVRVPQDEDAPGNAAVHRAVADRTANTHPELARTSHEMPEHHVPTYVSDEVEWHGPMEPTMHGYSEPDGAVLESGCGMEYGPDCAGAVCQCGDATCAGDCEMCEVVSIWIPAPKHFTLFGGVQAFKGPLDGVAGNSRDRGNFGIHEGFNWGGCMPWFGHSQVGYQIGYQLTHSQLHGSSTTPLGQPTSSAHTQQFVTAGLFRRTRGPGWTYGAVWDVLRDDRFGAIDLHQLRAEIGLVNRFGREWGFATAVHTNDTERFGTPYRAVNQFLLYYRIHAANGGEARIYGGGSDNDNAILGANFLVPVHDCWSFQGGCTYLTAPDSGSQGAAAESWNLGMSLVWHLGGGAISGRANPYRPLFDVADNGSLLVEQRR